MIPARRPSVPSPPTSVGADPAPTPTLMGAVLWFWLGAAALAVGGIVLGIGLASGWGVLAALGGVLVGLLAAFAGVFGITSHGSTAKSRFNAVTLLGILLGLGSLALGVGLGGLVGAGAGLLGLGLAAVVLGIGVAVGIPD